MPDSGGRVVGSNNQVASDGLWTYTYDDAGELVEKTQGAGAATWWYTYDVDGELVRAAYSDNGGSPTVVVDYLYDVFGNLVGRTETDGGVVVGDERYAVDGWDPAKSEAIAAENYDRYAVLVPDGSGGWQIAARTVFGSGFDEPVATITSAGLVAWFAADRQGSVESVFDNSGAVLASATYDPFGNILSGGVWSVTGYGFQGGSFDSATGLANFGGGGSGGGRWYDSVSMQWLREDPLGLTPDANPRRFVGNDPTNGTDPSGQDSVPLVSGFPTPPGIGFPSPTGPLNRSPGLPIPLPPGSSSVPIKPPATRPDDRSLDPTNPHARRDALNGTFHGKPVLTDADPVEKIERSITQFDNIPQGTVHSLERDGLAEYIGTRNGAPYVIMSIPGINKWLILRKESGERNFKAVALDPGTLSKKAIPPP